MRTSQPKFAEISPGYGVEGRGKHPAMKQPSVT